MTDIIFALIQFLIKVWVLMLALGGIHERYTEVPPIGWTVSTLVVLVASCLTNWTAENPEDK